MTKQPIIEVRENRTSYGLYFDHQNPQVGLYVIKVEEPKFSIIGAAELRKGAEILPHAINAKIDALRAHGYDLLTNDVAVPR